MRPSRTLLSFTFLLWVFQSAGFAQSTHGFCGTGEIDQVRFRENLVKSRTRGPLTPRAPVDVPIRFKLIRRGDGTGAASFDDLLNLMTSLNVDFAPRGIRFYLAPGQDQPWDYLSSDNLYDNSGEFTRELVQNKSSAAVTIFVPNDATPPGGTGEGVTLGYYHPQNDYLVFARSEIGNNASTASHELGHFFGLPHTFQGWDCEGWNDPTDYPTDNPVTITKAPCLGGEIDVEFVTRGAGANCAEAGDGFCDTPADYNMGFGAPACGYAGDVKDKNGELIRPDPNNFMGYFLACSEYTFSDEQAAMMLTDYEDTSRDYLRRLSGPTGTGTVSEAVNVISPLPDAITDSASVVTVKWEPVPDAAYYALEVSKRRSFDPLVEEVVVSNATEYTLTGLEENERYYYRIRPFSDVSFGDGAVSQSFTTANLTSVTDPQEAVEQLVITPNPVRTGEAVAVELTLSNSARLLITVRDLTGRVLSQNNDFLGAGDHTIAVPDAERLAPGSYVATVTSEQGVSSRAFLVQ